MERLYTPWRMKYVTSTHNKEKSCIFCHILHESAEHDQENYLIYRGKMTFVVMNLYPYNTGHLMVLPYQHVANLTDLTPQVQMEMITLASYFTNLLSQLMHPDGFNVGINMGRAAGAGIDSHLHMHLVPRWNGDSNFMSVVGETRILPEELGDTYDKIVALLQQQPPSLEE